ncbi:hypothetical protein STRIP9103_07844 [Streptomyces ipomoeae 91-03]|uniref:Uncharacterized protein n=1 Tax=Streptomyces ipomoeae 91-03 TaxID=698759 RepID=L1L2Z7_9ACTN|nr:hypothetical protein STRIP9103_07844 [Streptomyces ipomoeae 91-03]
MRQTGSILLRNGEFAAHVHRSVRRWSPFTRLLDTPAPLTDNHLRDVVFRVPHVPRAAVGRGARPRAEGAP